MLFEKEGFALRVNITDDYFVRCIVNQINKETHTYKFTWELGSNSTAIMTVNNIESDNEDQNNTFEITSENSNYDIAKFVLDKYHEGYFDSEIEYYEKLVKAMDIGFDKMEEE